MFEGHVLADLFYYGASVDNAAEVMILWIKFKTTHRSSIGHVLDNDSTMLAGTRMIRYRATE